MSNAGAALQPLPSKMREHDFVLHFGALYEHSPWVARETWQRGLTPQQDSVAGLIAALSRTMLDADHEQQLALIKAHPDLAGKAAVRGELTSESSGEQASAGIDQCDPEEFDRFQKANTAYRQKFGFPFVMAVKGSNRHAILAAFEQRLQHDPDTEFQQALTEINRIARLRLETLAGADRQTP